ncbi:hypothetical protein PM082_024844 [Marasmius tenuissimus]|nr:hypothetical protein PM082_024844 [Marasmius tenuissimus]
MASDEEIVQQAVEPYTSIGQVIVYPIATLSSMFLVYGMYIIIFGLTINILWHRQESSASKAYMRWIIALFLLTTISNTAFLWGYMYDTLAAFNAAKTRDYISYFEFLTGESLHSAPVIQLGLQQFSSIIISCIFDYLMINRCYVIWGYNKWILYPFAFLAVVTDTMAFVLTAINTSAYQHHATALYMTSINIVEVLGIVSAVYASLLTLLTAGRIWWTVRQVGKMTGSGLHTKYNIFVTTILESGLLYSATTVVGILVPRITDPGNNGLVPFNPNVISVQMGGIAPTIIIVRITYGQAIESVQQMVSTLHFAEGVNISQHQSTAAHGAINLQQSLAAVRGRGMMGQIKMDQDISPLSLAENSV